MCIISIIAVIVAWLLYWLTFMMRFLGLPRKFNWNTENGDECPYVFGCYRCTCAASCANCKAIDSHKIMMKTSKCLRLSPSSANVPLIRETLFAPNVLMRIFVKTEEKKKALMAGKLCIACFRAFSQNFLLTLG